MNELIKDECGVDPEEDRFVIVGCEDVPGFEAVANGEKVSACCASVLCAGDWKLVDYR